MPFQEGHILQEGLPTGGVQSRIDSLTGEVIAHFMVVPDGVDGGGLEELMESGEVAIRLISLSVLVQGLGWLRPLR